MSKVKVRIIKKQDKIEEVKGNIKIKEREGESPLHRASLVAKNEVEGKESKLETKKEDFIAEERTTKSATPIIPIENIRPVRNLDEIEAPKREEQRRENVVMYSERDPSKAMREYSETSSLRDVRRADEETRRVYNPERAEAPQAVNRNIETRSRAVRPLSIMTPSEIMEEKRDASLRNPRSEFEQIRGFYKDYEDVRKYDERGREPSKEKRRKMI